jgi:two-component system cell cycle sensor histidine kinase/response regulator CckA
MGCIVTEAESGRAALAILERNTPCDLMVTDLVMPGLSGLDTLRLARRNRPDLKVLFTSGYADLSRFGHKLRNHPVLRKPFKPEALAEAVQTALHEVYPDEPHNVVPLQRDRR